MVDFKNIQTYIEKARAYDDAIGIRIVDEPVAIGSILPNSHIWVDGEYTDDELNGTSAIRIDKDFTNNNHGGYYGNVVLIISGNQNGYGEDYNEIIVKDATVIGVINIKD